MVSEPKKEVHLRVMNVSSSDRMTSCVVQLCKLICETSDYMKNASSRLLLHFLFGSLGGASELCWAYSYITLRMCI